MRQIRWQAARGRFMKEPHAVTGGNAADG